MIPSEVVALLVVTGAISIALIVRVLASSRAWPSKVAAVCLLAVPVAGPLLYGFIYLNVPPQHPNLQVRHARGTFLHDWLSMKPLLESILKERRASREESGSSSDTNPPEPK